VTKDRIVEVLSAIDRHTDDLADAVFGLMDNQHANWFAKALPVYSDHLDPPRAVTDAEQTTVWQWHSDPFGPTPADKDPDGDGVPTSYNLRFPGQYFDAESGTHYNYFRDYDPNLGRYVQSYPFTPPNSDHR
jgi:RHS repeat-associated protein